MKIDFGVVKKYYVDRGFGFVARTFFTSQQTEIFFHIKNVKKTRSDLAEKLDNEEPIETIYFWYEIEVTSKGEQVRTILKSITIHEIGLDNFPSIIGKIERIWRDINSEPPIWLHDVTFDLMGTKSVSELSSERKELENQKIALEKERRIIQERAQEEEEAKLQKIIVERKIQDEIEEKEFQQLVIEMKPLGVKHSSQLSRYIVQHGLGYKYKNIAGIVKMEQDGTIWNFNGGFPPHIYARLCNELGLSNRSCLK